MKRKQNLKELSIRRMSSRSRELKTPLKTEMVAIDLENSKSPLICQLCLCKSENYRPLFEESSKTLMESIKSVFQIEISHSDNQDLSFKHSFLQLLQDEEVPDQICTHCVEKIDEFIAFRQMVVENHQKLQLDVVGRKDIVVVEPYIKLEEKKDVEEEIEVIKQTPKTRRKPIRRKSVDRSPMIPDKDSLDILEVDKKDKMDALLENYTFECPQCHQPFPRFKLLLRHVRTEHNMKQVSLKCSQLDCNMVFEQRYKLIKHLRKHGLIPPSSDFKFFCHTCGSGFEHRSLFKSHLKRASCGPSLNAMFQCHYCTALYRRKGPLKRHFQLNHGFDMYAGHKYKCPQCSRRYISESSLKMHIRVCHDRTEEVVCEVCAKVLKSKSSLKLHLDTVHFSGGAKPTVTCPVCGKELKTKTVLVKHLRRTHQQQPMNCEICSIEFRNRERMLIHLRRAHKPIKFNCLECDKGFNRREQLNSHMTTHGIGANKFKCEWCDKTFNFSSTKSLHKKTQHPVEWQQSRDETYKWTKKIQQASAEFI